jgi:hypothetical protein
MWLPYRKFDLLAADRGSRDATAGRLIFYD